MFHLENVGVGFINLFIFILSPESCPIFCCNETMWARPTVGQVQAYVQLNDKPIHRDQDVPNAISIYVLWLLYNDGDVCVA